jgi:arylsulfatase
VTSSESVVTGKELIKAEFTYTKGEPSGSGVVALYINDKKVGEATVARTVSSLYAHEGLNLGFDDLTPVSDSYKAPFAFTGKLNKVILDFK